MYIYKYIYNPSKVRILKYAKHTRKMFEIYLYPSNPSNKGNEFDDAFQMAQNKHLPKEATRKNIKDDLPHAM